MVKTRMANKGNNGYTARRNLVEYYDKREAIDQSRAIGRTCDDEEMAIGGGRI